MQTVHQRRLFRVSGLTIWGSSLLIGIMASIPKFLTLHLGFWELVSDGLVAMAFSLFIWYLNSWLFPAYSTASANAPVFISKKLGIVLLAGIAVMAVLSTVYLLSLPSFNFGAIILMWEFRGLIINCTISLFFFLFYQAYWNRMLSTALEKSRADNLAAKFEMLAQQVNPHFLFNSLNTLVSMIDAQDKKASRFVVMLSEFYRSSLDKRKANLVTVREELNILQAYCFLLEARFEAALAVRIEINEQHLRSMIPPFTLQLLLENCIKHNVVSLETPLRVHVYSDGSFIMVENNMQPKRNPEPSTGTGLTNITERYLAGLHTQPSIVKEDHLFRIQLPVTA